MTEIDSVTTRIAAAVEQQGIATKEISRNIQSAVSATQNVAHNVAGTTIAVEKRSRAAAQVLEVAEYMNEPRQRSSHIRGPVSPGRRRRHDEAWQILISAHHPQCHQSFGIKPSAARRVSLAAPVTSTMFSS